MVKCSKPTQGQKTQAPEQIQLYVCPFAVLYDTREQAPWTFQNIVLGGMQWVVHRQLATFATGDYSAEGLKDRLLIERKNGADFVQSVTRDAKRFKREHERMMDVVKFGGEIGGFCCVIVEGSLSEICDSLDAEAGRKVNSDHVLGACASWPARYGVPWFFAGDRRRAELLAFRIMVKQWADT